MLENILCCTETRNRRHCVKGRLP